MNRKLAVGFAEFEVLDEKVMDMGMFSDGARTVRNIAETSLLALFASLAKRFAL